MKVVALWCPSCDRMFVGLSFPDALEKTKKHVDKAHPDYDPNWYDQERDK